MTIQIDIESNSSRLATVLGGIARTQIPYATQQALNDVVFDASREAKSELAESLTLRNPFSQSGIQVNKASKADWPAIQAEVGIEERRSYLIDQVLGGKRSGSTRHGRAVLADNSLRNSRGRVPKANRPGQLIKRRVRRSSKPSPFLIYSKKFKNEVLVRRTGDKRYPLEIIYAFTKDVRVKRTFEMDIVVERLVRDTYDTAFAKALQKAMPSAKTKGERRASTSRGTTIGSGR